MIKYKQEKGLSYRVIESFRLKNTSKIIKSIITKYIWCTLGHPSPRFFARAATTLIEMDWEVGQEISVFTHQWAVDGDVGKQAWAHCVLLASPALLSSAIPSFSTTSSTKELQGSCLRLALTVSQPFVRHLYKEALPRHFPWRSLLVHHSMGQRRMRRLR